MPATIGNVTLQREADRDRKVYSKQYKTVNRGAKWTKSSEVLLR